MSGIVAWTIDPALALVVRAALALLFLFTAGHKLRDVNAFAAAVAAYDLVPQQWQRTLSWSFAVLEVAAGIFLFTNLAIAPFAAAALLVVYTTAIIINLGRGRRDIDCGCAGPAHRMPLSGGLVVRNLMLILAALCATLPPTSRPQIWLDAVTVIASVTALSFLYAAADLALANAVRLRPLIHARLRDLLHEDLMASHE